MMFAYCWHRPGPMHHRGRFRLCRNCGVSIEPCPCVSWGRATDPDCKCCEGSGWVGLVRSRLTELAQTLDLGVEVSA
jgi:hypothetical protein